MVVADSMDGVKGMAFARAISPRRNVPTRIMNVKLNSEKSKMLKSVRVDDATRKSVRVERYNPKE
jgi:hypothetical protein